MAEPSGNEIKSGVMILVAAGLLAVLLAAVGPCRALLYEREEVRVVFRDVAGLKPNSPVTYSGVEIGRVKDISIIQLDEGNLARLPELRRHHVFELPIGDLEDADRIYRIDDPEERRSEILKAVRGKTMVELTLELLKIGQFESCRIDDRITVVSTLMGDTAVEISPGSERFCSAGELLIGDAGTLFSDVRDSVNDIRRMMRRADRALGGQKGEFKEAMKSITKATERFAKISENIEGATAEAKDILAENKADIRRTVKDLSAAAAAGRDVLEDGAPRLKKVLASAEKITGTLSSGVTKAAGKLDAALDAARRAAVSAEGLMLGVKPQLRDVLGEAGDVLKRSSRLVDRLAGTVGETRPELRRALLNVKGATRNVEEMTALLARRPWLVLRPSKEGDRDLAALYVSSRHLHDATSRLAEATDRLGELGRSGRLPRADAERLRELIEQVRLTAGEIDSSRRSLKERIEEIRRPGRKGGGRRFERSREAAPEYPDLDSLRHPDRR